MDELVLAHWDDGEYAVEGWFFARTFFELDFFEAQFRAFRARQGLRWEGAFKIPKLNVSEPFAVNFALSKDGWGHALFLLESPTITGVAGVATDALTTWQLSGQSPAGTQVAMAMRDMGNKRYKISGLLRLPSGGWFGWDGQLFPIDPTKRVANVVHIKASNTAV